LLEYAYNDFSIALVAQGLGKSSDFEHFVQQSGDWSNIWNPKATSTGFSGFIQPRNANGTFFLDPKFDHNGTKFDPRHCSPVFGHTDCFLVRLTSGGAVNISVVDTYSRTQPVVNSTRLVLGSIAFTSRKIWLASLSLWADRRRSGLCSAFRFEQRALRLLVSILPSARLDTFFEKGYHVRAVLVAMVVAYMRAHRLAFM
jgi:hypothetical protein